MSHRIKNRHTGNYVSRNISSSIKAYTLCDRLNESSPDQQFEVVSLDRLAEHLSPEQREMTEQEKEAIGLLKDIKYSSGGGDNNQVDFANVMILKVQTNELTISDRQAAYLWHVIYHYRRQINSRELIAVAEKNRIY